MPETLRANEHQYRPVYPVLWGDRAVCSEPAVEVTDELL